MTAVAPLSPGSPRVPVYPYDLAVEDALEVARQAHHIANPTLPLKGFSNGLPGYRNACFRNSLISLLINLPPFSGWIVSNTQGQLDSSPTAHLLENVIREYFATNLSGRQARADGAIQRLYNYFNLIKPVNPTKIENRYGPNTQQDAAEVLYLLLGQIGAELTGNDPASDSFSALSELLTTAAVTCARCGRGSRRCPTNQDVSSETVLRTNLISSTASFKDLIAGNFAGTPIPAYCRRCGQDAPRSAQWKILRTPEVLLIDVDQTAPHPTVLGKTVKLGLQVPAIPEHLDLGEYLHEAAATTAQYRLFGVVNHKGATPYAGHYVSHVRHTSGSWFQLNDSKVSASSVANLQSYALSKGTNQMIPRLIAYVKIHDDEDDNAIATRTAKHQQAPRAFRQPQIVYDEWMTVEELQMLCKSHKLNPGNAKTGDSLRKVIDAANSAESTFTTRLKDWLVTTILSTGLKVVRSKTKLQLAAQLRNFMKSQHSGIQAQQPGTGSGQAPGADLGDHPNTESGEQLPDGGEQPPAQGESDAVIQIVLDLSAANARILDLQRTIADLQRRIRIIGADRDSRPGINGQTPQYVNTNYFRCLIQRLPAPPSPPRGTKRKAEDDRSLSPETRKRGAIQRAGRICAAIDAGDLQYLQNDNGEHIDPVDNQNNGSGRGSNARRNFSDRLNRPRDSDQVRRHPRGGLSINPHASRQRRCHPCPTIAGEIHHMHAQVCGYRQGVRASLSTSSETAKDTAIIDAHGSPEDSSDGYEDAPIVFSSRSDVDYGDETRGSLFDSTLNIEGDEDHTHDSVFEKDGDMTRDFLNDHPEQLKHDDLFAAFLKGAAEAREAHVRQQRGTPSDGDDTLDFLDEDGPLAPRAATV